MRDNFEIIKPLLDFTEKNTFYFIQILKRRKENPDMKTGVQVMDNFYIYDENDLDKVKDKIIDRCVKHNARAYINVNRLDLERIAMHTQKLIIDYMMQGQYKNVKNAYATCCGQHHAENNKRWLIDIDEEELPFINVIRDYVEVLHKEIPGNKYKIIAEIPSKTGIHIITNPFNMKKFADEMSKICTKLQVHKNNPTILYIA